MACNSIYRQYKTGEFGEGMKPRLAGHEAVLGSGRVRLCCICVCLLLLGAVLPKTFLSGEAAAKSLSYLAGRIEPRKAL